MHECKDEIMFIQGDVVETYFYIEGIEREYIENLYFSCEAEKILTVLPYSEEQEGYCFRLTSEQTSSLRPKFCTYDLTLELIDGNTMTLLHGCSFIVLKKRNTLNPDDYRDDVEEEPNEGDGEDGDGENGENSGEPEGGDIDDNNGEDNGDNNEGDGSDGGEDGDGDGDNNSDGDDLGDSSGDGDGDGNTDNGDSEDKDDSNENNSGEGEDNTNEDD